ncbi:hypothetical protein EYZ11_003036 [Aspergillus tanneri]|uniref:Bud22 domain-containing protein n=1 Tax=Aspergillus tanneri TaxID=1220188 RepID=A0A4S3JPF6_9EURO|nr:uncharacterized protein ATNIH1004_008691 [Aspergillus tanneri]KAA8644487.1 hypothetical protein ATNIH1004_008691 [Aspergillus tanneri]THC97502.1 hypothetical protein EYZ11_003036 [Aspergillus tanneri]
MLKRKFSDRKYTATEPTDSLQTIRLKQKFDQGVLLLSRALKTARGFERQKLGRREKTAKSQGQDETLKRLEEEVQVLKTLDPPVAAAKYLLKQMLKTKRIAESPTFIQFKQSKSKISTEGPKSPAEANVLARLYKSTPVKNVYPDIMTGIRKLLGLDDASRGKNAVTGKVTSESSGGRNEEDYKRDDDDFSGSDFEAAPSAVSRSSTKLPRSDEEEEVIGMSDAESEDFARFNSRLAPDSEDDSEGEDQASDVSEGIDLTTSKPYPDISISRSPSPDSPPPPKKQKSKIPPMEPVTSTTFLPSLTMGGYFSGSEAETEDVDNEPPRRKNRMGQQARRALWEKKFGSGANHLKNQKHSERNNRDSGWDSRRGAIGDGDGSRGRRGRGRGRGGGSMGGKIQRQEVDRPAPRGSAAKKPQKDNRPLHPSWEAARRAKEQKTASFQGKKFVFD